jgi:hypothetical protein
VTRHVPPPQGATPLMVEFRPAMRTLIEDAIESMMLLLDEIDGDADFEAEPDEEEGGDLEPSLGSCGGVDQSCWGGVGGYAIDAEGPDDNGFGDRHGLSEQLGEDGPGEFEGSGCVDA